MVMQILSKFTKADFVEVKNLALKELSELKGQQKEQIAVAWVIAVLIVLKKKKILGE
jgi:hypothetical protein